MINPGLVHGEPGFYFVPTMTENILDPVDNIQIVADEFLRKVNEEIARASGIDDMDRGIKIGLELARTMFNDVIDQNNAIEGE